MGADKTKSIMTLSSGVTQPLLADVQYFDLYSSSALNRKLKNIVLPGFYCGFEPVPGTGLSVRITSENSEGKGAASVDVNNVQISVQQIEDVIVSVKAGATNIIVLEANFEHGVKTIQVDSTSSVSAARIYARTDNTIGQNQIELCRVVVPSGATAVTKEMIVLKYRVNRAVGVEFSNEISSTEERKAATPLAVKTIHDLVDTKAPIDSPHLKGIPTAPTAEQGTNSTQIANTAFVKAAITALINGAPGTLDTLKEIAAAINNDPNFSTTINNALALKAPLASPALTGIPTAPTAAQGTNNTQIATTAYVRAAISALVGSSPEALDTLNELAAALGNDPNFATTMTNALAGKQPLDATLTALAGLATGANKLPYFTGTDTVSQTDLTSVGRDILAKTSVLAVIQYLGLGEVLFKGDGRFLAGTFVSDAIDRTSIGVRAATGCQFMRAYKAPDAPNQTSYWQIVVLPEATSGAVACLAMSGNVIYLGSGTTAAITTWTPLTGRQPLDATLTALSGKSPSDIVNYLGISSNLIPVGVPLPWPLAAPPSGWLLCNGQTFTATQYPALAVAYPALATPDLRGLFIRGLDNGRGYDPLRDLGTEQLDAFASHRHQPEQSGAGNRFVADYSEDGTGSGAQIAMGANNYAMCRYTNYVGGTETRPRNFALNYIVRAA
ncbi:tail fiber protein [Salmonella enterica subsp. enterica serovar Corvallis]